MAARHCRAAVFDLVFFDLAHNVARQVDRETEIVERIDVTLRARREFGEFVDIRHRRDRQPVFAKLVERQIIADTLFDCVGREAVPDDVRRIAGDVVENRRIDLHIEIGRAHV